MYATVKDGKYTGAFYNEATDNVKQWHIDNGLMLVEIDSKPEPEISSEAVEDEKGEIIYTEEVWEEVPFDVLQKAKLDELKQARINEINSPLNNVDVDSPEDRENIQGVIEDFDLLYPSGVVTWTMADNTEQELTKADLEAVVIGYKTRKAQAFAKYQALKDTVLNAKSTQELDTIKWQL